MRRWKIRWVAVSTAASVVAAAGVAVAVLAPTSDSQAAAGLAPGVYFENEGSLSGWSRSYSQKDGVIRNVASPSFKGGNAIEARQTYINEQGGYHSETIRAGAESVGQDRYYGQAVYIAPSWKFHNQNVTFQQFSPEKPEGPWLLMFIQGDEIRFGGSGGISGTVGKITNLRGTWIRVVTRLKLAGSGGAMEVWLNGRKTVSKLGRILPRTSKTIRWSSGIYCTAWREGKPAGGGTLSIYHDHHRIASTYALAEPANW
jgi:hypothetical protein